MGTVMHLARKEFIVLLRDWHALLLLFVMPAVFIIIMSVALRDRFAADAGAPLTYFLVNHDADATSDTLARGIRANTNARDLGGGDETRLRDDVARDKAFFLVVIPDGFAKAMMSQAPLHVSVYSGPGVDPASQKLFDAIVREAVARVYVARSFSMLGLLLPLSGKPSTARDSTGRMSLDAAKALVSSQSLYQSGTPQAHPTSVQQNVPAWLLFAMFFVALPLATTWVEERRQGTFGRLRSLGVSPSALLIGKLVPYYVINWIQCALMLAVGVFLVPLFGGDRFALGDSPGGLIVMVLAVSFAAVSYALLIANLVSTTAQATILAGVSNLLLAALGGIMVPRFVMPLAMQKASLFSPMAWGLEGFLDIFLRHGTIATVLPWALGLGGFGAASLCIAGMLLGRDVRTFRIR